METYCSLSLCSLFTSLSLPLFTSFFFHLPLSFFSFHTHTLTHTRSFRVCPHFHSSPTAGWPDDLLHPVTMQRRSLGLKKKKEKNHQKNISFLFSNSAFFFSFFFFPLFESKLHDDQKILPRVRWWIGMEEGRKRTFLFFLPFLFFLKHLISPLLKSGCGNINSCFRCSMLHGRLGGDVRHLFRPPHTHTQ